MTREEIHLSDEEMQSRFQAFLDQYETKYMSDALGKIKETFGKRLDQPQLDIVSQVYAALNIIPKEYSYYEGVAQSLEKTFGVDRNIVEVGGGMYPAFAEIIDQKQRKINKGTITVYDPYLVPDKLGSIHLMKENFQKDTRLKNADLLVGLLPCQQTVPIIERANREHLEFLILMCGCTHFSPDYLMNGVVSEGAWHNYVYKIADQTKESKAILDVEYLPEQYIMPYPILKKTHSKKRLK